MAKLSIADGVITIELRLWDKILAVHGSLRIPLEDVVSASAGPPPPVPWFTKLVGTNAPGIAAMGTFFTHEGLAFYDYAAGHRSLILEMRHETLRARHRRDRRAADRRRCRRRHRGSTGRRANTRRMSAAVGTGASSSDAAARTVAALRTLFRGRFAVDFSVRLWDGTHIAASGTERFTLIVRAPFALRAAFRRPST